jgi:hypothetical protein
MTSMTQRDALHVAENLVRFVETEALPGTGIDQNEFWKASPRSCTISRRRTATWSPSASACKTN